MIQNQEKEIARLKTFEFSVQQLETENTSLKQQVQSLNLQISKQANSQQKLSNE